MLACEIANPISRGEHDYLPRREPLVYRGERTRTLGMRWERALYLPRRANPMCRIEHARGALACAPVIPRRACRRYRGGALPDVRGERPSCTTANTPMVPRRARPMCRGKRARGAAASALEVLWRAPLAYRGARAPDVPRRACPICRYDRVRCDASIPPGVPQ